MMRIDRIELFHVAMPLISPWRTAYGEDHAVESVLCRMSSGSLAAWGESSPLAAPCYSPEWAGGVFALCQKWLAPALLNKDIRSGDELQRLLGHFKGNPFAKAVLDTAWWALHSQETGRPLHQLLGAVRDEVVVGADFGVTDHLSDLIHQVGEALTAGFPRIKLKFRPGWDLPMLRAVRQEFPDAIIHIDCNSGYTLADLPLFQEIDALDLAMIEQPLAHDDILDHAALQASLRTKICLDESISSIRQAERAIAQKACQFVNIKPGRVGGLTNALKIHHLCQSAGIPCWVGGMLESAVGASQCVALAMLPNFTYPADIFPSSRFYTEDLAESPIELFRNSEGIPSVAAPAVLPEPDAQRLQQLTLQYADLRG